MGFLIVPVTGSHDPRHRLAVAVVFFLAGLQQPGWALLHVGVVGRFDHARLLLVISLHIVLVMQGADPLNLALDRVHADLSLPVLV